MKEERFSSGTPSKNKISNFGDVSPLYPNFVYHSLSLNLKKNKSQEKTFIFVDCEIIICFDTLKVYITVVKEFMYFYVTTWSMLLLHASLFSFYSPNVILLRIVLLIPLKYHTQNQSCRLLQYNIITTKTYRSIFFHYLGEGSESGLVGVWIVWNLEPLASGGQSGPKLVPHIIFQFLYAWEKNSERGLII